MKLKVAIGIITLASMLISIFSTMQSMKHKRESNRLENNLYIRTVEYEDALGRKVTETSQLEIKVSELKDVMKKDSSQLNDYEKTLKKIGTELKNSERKLKHVENAMFVEMETSNKISERLVGTFYRGIPAKSASINNAFGKYDITYLPQNDSIYIDLIQRNELFLDLYKERKPNKRGTQSIIPIRWFKRWVYRGSVKSMNDSTEIKSFTIITIPKK